MILRFTISKTSLAIFDESVEATFPLTFLGEIYGAAKGLRPCIFLP